MSRDIRVVIADDHELARMGVRSSLEGRGFTVVAEEQDGRGAVAAALRLRPHLCLLDINMPHGGGIAAARDITDVLPETTVVMLTVSRDEADLFEALRAGARGYLLKDTDPQRLPETLRAVMAGEVALPRALVSRLVDEFRGRQRRRRLLLGGRRQVQLSEREWAVLEGLRDGLTTTDIAHQLDISPVTVRRLDVRRIRSSRSRARR